MTSKTGGLSVAGEIWTHDSADVASKGRSFHVRATTTRKARLATVDVT